MTEEHPGAEGYNGLDRVEETLPSEMYVDPAHHRRELDAIWYRNWVYLCRADALEGPGSYRTFDLGSQRILLLRDQDGALRAFHNTCRHRGAQLCRAESGRFGAKRIVCPYHRWSYSLQGALLAHLLPGPESEDFDKADYPLYAIAVEDWAGFVFVNLAGGDGLVRRRQLRSGFGTTRLIGRSRTWSVGHSYRAVLDCNWKIFWDNFNECLHCPWRAPGALQPGAALRPRHLRPARRPTLART